jgi:hypothetical protein
MPMAPTASVVTPRMTYGCLSENRVPDPVPSVLVGCLSEIAHVQPCAEDPDGGRPLLP